MLASIKDVARLAGVSISTASNVINDAKYVSDELRKSVLDAVDELHYETDLLARNMKRSNTMVLGIVISTLKSIFVLPVLSGIQSIAADQGYQLNFSVSEDTLENERQIIKILVASKVDGIIVASAARYNDEGYFRYLASLSRGKKKIPIISLERNLVAYGISSIHVDNVLGGYLATSHLIEKQCKRIVCIAGPAYSDLVSDRISGYKKALLEAGIPFEQDLLVKGDFTPLSGHKAIKRLLLDGLRFDGVFAANDQMAVGALKALKEFNIAVPDDVKVIGFDNTFVSSIIEPSLSTINVPIYRMGTTAVKLMIDILSKNEQHPKAISVPMTINLIERSSTGRRVGSEWELEYW